MVSVNEKPGEGEELCQNQQEKVPRQTLEAHIVQVGHETEQNHIILLFRSAEHRNLPVPVKARSQCKQKDKISQFHRHSGIPGSLLRQYSIIWQL
jgi:hypothetical protein